MMELAAAMATMPKKSGMQKSGMQKAFTNKVQSMGGMGALKSQAAKAMSPSMLTRPPVIANKARGTQSSSMHRVIPTAFGPMMF